MKKKKMNMSKNKIFLLIFFNCISFVVSMMQGNTIFMSLIYSLFLGSYYVFYIFLTKNVIIGLMIIFAYYILVYIANSIEKGNENEISVNE
ncbi:MAG: hypothetical protein BWY04_01494 [candidate division CPR1 bacterium ADurb.Bin160]|uniref:Uncharacterized protein n=1 Tax=candidate division CPR1 bacterium ADurb.Bin160 TaxID=1852826 RepID=A0A1V5ZIB6_9BACT|nr:MAG: hypothetical protein BWY04_01494 [candidate division CPR1 bacterium ADurb.Bin160]